MVRKAILLANLGSPDAASVPAVKRYLREFLMDERVIDMPYLLRSILVKGVIVPFRAPKSAAKYQTIWTEHGSPLIHITRQLTKLVAEDSGLPAYMCMRYANPTPKSVLAEIAKAHPDLQELVLVPLYPHFSMSSYETAVEHVLNAYKQGDHSFSLKIVIPYFDDPDYIDALASSIRPFLEKPYDHLLFSYHGIPERHLKKTDPSRSYCLSCDDCCERPSLVHELCYRHQVIETTKLTAKALGLSKEQYSFSFQSRLGNDKWLKPYTAEMLKRFPAQGVRNLLVVCPAFVSDCLETLEEIRVEGKEIFHKAGGHSFHVVPCLNTDEKWVKTITKLVNDPA
jgi:ferrochelatase